LVVSVSPGCARDLPQIKNGKGGGQTPLAASLVAAASLRGGLKRYVVCELVLVTSLADHGDVRSAANALRIGEAIHQATEVFLKKRRKARNPVMPIPSKAHEAGSGTASAE
jgi:hypothetical protein